MAEKHETKKEAETIARVDGMPTASLPGTSTNTRQGAWTEPGHRKSMKYDGGIYELAHQSIAIALYATRWKQATRSLHNFCKETSVHGLKNILTKQHKTHRIVWAVFVFVALIACSTHFSLRMKSYWKYRHQELVRTEISNVIRFPDVTFCKLTPVKRTKMLDTLNLVWKYFEEPLHEEQCLASYLAVNYPLELGDPQAFMRIVDEEDVRGLSSLLEDMLIECSFGNVKCDAEDFSQFLHHTYYNCYTFNSTRFIERLKTSQSRSRGLSSHDARLLLTLFIEGADGTFTEPLYHTEEIPWVKGLDYAVSMKTLSSYGIRVHIHNSGVKPAPSQSGFEFSPGFTSNLRLEPNIVNREMFPYKSNCTDKVTIEETGSMYSQNECVEVCVQKRVAERCGCQHVTLPTLEHWPRCGRSICNLSELYCYNDVRGTQVYSECVTQCPKSCYEITYDTFTTSTYWPSSRTQKSFYEDVAIKNPYVERLLGNSSKQNLQRIEQLDLIRKNFLQLNVFLKDDYVTHTYEVPQYTPAGLATEFGGTLGLWIGISAVTITEFIELLVDVTSKLISAAIARSKRNRKT